MAVPVAVEFLPEPVTVVTLGDADGLVGTQQSKCLNMESTSALWGIDRNFPLVREFIVRGSGLRQDARHIITPPSARSALLIAAIMSMTFLAEVTVFAAIGMF